MTDFAALSRQITREVQTMFTEGDQHYLQSLPRAELLKVVDNELRFLGLYPLDNDVIQQQVRQFLDEHLDSWCAMYLPQMARYEIIDPSSFVQVSSGACMGHGPLDTTRYIGFVLPLGCPRIQGSTLSQNDPHA